MSELLRLVPIFVLIGVVLIENFLIITENREIDNLYNLFYNQTKIDQMFSDRINNIEHNQYAMQQEILAITNSSQVIDGFNMTSGHCADGYKLSGGNGTLYHCDWKGFHLKPLGELMS